MNYRKKYEKALEYMRTIYPTLKGADKEDIEHYFPELKESEDERIRKALIQHIKDKVSVISGWRKEELIAWLEKQGEVLENIQHKEAMLDCQTCANYKNECFPDRNIFKYSYPIKYSEKNPQDIDEKQGEQKPADEAEPKFKVGDWVIDKQDIVHQIANVIKIVTNHTYGYDIVGGGYFNDNTEGVRLWTIQDAKDGDVLATHLSPEGDWIGIYKESVDSLGFKTHCFLNAVGEFVINPNRCRNHGTHGLHPATKEQSDLLFQKMKEAGYEWDDEKNELRKIEHNPTEDNRKISDSAWSEEDEELWYSTIEYIQTYPAHRNSVVDWLKSIKERMKGE